MKKRKGRTCRHRKRKKQPQACMYGVNLSKERCFVHIRQWLKQQGFQDSTLQPADFPGTGRGLMTTEPLKAGELIISLPENCLLTTVRVLESYLGDYIKRWKPPISPVLALCTFLIAERHIGVCSAWKPYIDVFPKTYSCPVYFAEEVVDCLPSPLRRKAQEQRNAVRKLYISSRPFFFSLQPLFHEHVEDLFNYNAFQWAWCSINTRAVYLKPVKSKYLCEDREGFALAPYLDLLNHNPQVRIQAEFNNATRCYEIKTLVPYKRYDQVFICYGPHDSHRLLLEYGFVSGNNPNSVVYVEKDVIFACFSEKDKQIAQKMSILMEHDFLENLTFDFDGPSWRLLTALKLLCLEPEEFNHWKNILHGASVSEFNEKKSSQLAKSVCLRLIHENQEAVQKVSSLKKARDELQEQLQMVEALRLEELRILQASAELLNK